MTPEDAQGRVGPHHHSATSLRYVATQPLSSAYILRGLHFGGAGGISYSYSHVLPCLKTVETLKIEFEFIC